jgi:hypothetical protein
MEVIAIVRVRRLGLQLELGLELKI